MKHSLVLTSFDDGQLEDCCKVNLATVEIFLTHICVPFSESTQLLLGLSIARRSVNQ